MSFEADLIICDVDGTLLHQGEEKPKRSVMQMLKMVSDAGKVFSLASGRSYNALYRLFENDTVRYICSDGTYIVENGEVIYKNAISPDTLTALIPMLSKCDYVLYGKDYAYTDSQGAAARICEAEGGRLKPISEYRNEDIFKLAVLKPVSYASHYIKVNRLLDECYSDSVWIEYTAPGADKGEAAEYLQKLCGIPYDRTAAFGDGLNDIQMLKKARYSYSVQGARSEIRSLARFHTSDAASEIVNQFLKLSKGAAF